MEELRFLVYLLEGVAAISGFYYLRTAIDRPTRYFVYFLLITFFVETIGLFPAIIYYNEELHFLKETFLAQNYWLYNPFLIISCLVYINYFKWNTNNIVRIKILNIFSIFYLISAGINLLFSNVFFVSFSSYSSIVGTILILISIGFYFYELLLSDKILSIKRNIAFYISVGALVFYLVSTPFFIYFKYFDFAISPEFVKLHSHIFMSANIFMYSCFTIGFLICSQKKNSYL